MTQGEEEHHLRRGVVRDKWTVEALRTVGESMHVAKEKLYFSIYGTRGIKAVQNEQRAFERPAGQGPSSRYNKSEVSRCDSARTEGQKTRVASEDTS